MLPRIPSSSAALLLACALACGSGEASRAVPGAVPGMQPGGADAIVRLEGAIGAAAQFAEKAPAEGGGPQGGQVAQAPATISEPEAPLLELRGYVVRATDEFSFRRCGGSRVYYVRAVRQEAARLSQHHRFTATSVFSPVYVVFKGRLRDDTVTIGEHRYRGIVDVEQMMVEQSITTTPACPAPPRGSMISR